MTKLTPGIIDSRSIRIFAAARPLQAAIGLVMIAGLVVALLFSFGYAIGKDRALADNRDDQMQDGR